MRLKTTRARLLALVAFVALASTAVVSASSAGSVRRLLFGKRAEAAPRVVDSRATLARQSLSVPNAPASVDGSLNVARRGHSATLLSDGKVLIVGGENQGGLVTEAEIFDPSTGSFSISGNLNTPRAEHSATRLPDGRVLIAGGRGDLGALNTTEIFDPSSGAFSSGPNLSSARSGHSATTLNDGRVVFAGGDAAGSVELLDVSEGSSTTMGSMTVARSSHTAALLQDNRVLIVGGRDADGNALSSGEIFDPADSTSSGVDGQLTVSRVRPHLRVLFDGKVQIIGGSDDGSMEIYDPQSNGFGAYAHVQPEGDTCANLPAQVQASQTRAALFHNEQSDATFDRTSHSMSELADQAIVIGGRNTAGDTLSSAPLFASSAAAISTDKLDYKPGQTVYVTGRGFEAGETVRIKVHEDPHTPLERGMDVVADDAGNFVGEYVVQDYDLDMKFLVGARGLTSGRTAQTTFTDASFVASVSGNWSNPATWGKAGTDPGTPGVNIPGASDTATISGGVTVTLNISNAACSSLSLTPSVNNTTATLTYISGGAGQLTVGGNVTIGSNSGSNRDGALNMTNGGTLKIGGGLTLNNAGFTAGTGTVEYNASAAQTIAVTTYNNLATSGSGTKTAAGALTVNGNLTIGSGTTFAAGTSLTHNIGGNWTNNGTFSFTTGSTINFNGSNSATINGSSSTAFQNITVNKGSSTSTVLEANGVGALSNTGNITLSNGLFKITTGTFQFNAGTTIASTSGVQVNGGTLNSSGSFSYTNNGLIRVSSGNANFGTASGNALTNSSTGTLDLQGGTTSVAGRLINSDGTATISGGTLRITTVGLNNAGNAGFEMTALSNLTMSNATVEFQNANAGAGGDLKITSGTGTKSITSGTFQIGNSSTPASQNFHISSGAAIQNLTINSTNTPAATLDANLTVNGTLTLSGGNITTGANTMIIGSGGTISRTSGYIVGALQRNIAADNYMGNPLTWEVGTSTSYNPVQITFPTVNTGGNFTVRANTGDHANIGTSTLNASKSVNVNWTLTNGGLTFSGNSKVVFTFNSGNLDAGVNTNNLIAGKYDSATWTYPNIGARTSTSTEVQGISSFSDFQLAESNCSAPSVTLQPTNQTVTYGATNVSFTSTASGDPAPTVQWQSSPNGTTWTDIGGATNTTLTINSPTVSLSGNQYRAVFTNTCNGTQTATSTAATLTVNKANAVVVVTPYTCPSTVYDGSPHTAAITSITGVNGETGATVGTVDVSNTTHTNAGTYASDSWSFTGTANYNDIGSTTISDCIAKANAVVVVTPYTCPSTVYDGSPHTAAITSITG
ncbi:MAG TPA: kelch repeat-containing protein, partial [Pyrinomonadaceae bacterium]